MDAAAHARLVNAYVERYASRFVWGADGVLREQDLHFEVFEEFNRYARNEPESCWLLVLGVLDATDDEYTLSNLAAGPFEDLINHHAAQFIDRIEREAQLKPKFRDLLSGVWDSVTPEIARRLQAARDVHNGA